MRRQRGFTLMEILVAMALTAIVTTSVLAIVRTQMQTFEMNDQLVRTQQNTRAGMDLVETIVRRACGGINTGLVQVFTPAVTSSSGLPCLRFYDGAAVSATAFTSSSANLPDAIEVIYATGTMTALTAFSMTTAPTITVIDASSFSTGDLVLLTDKSYANPALFKISSISGNVLSLGTFGTAPALNATLTSYVANSTSGTPVFKAASYSFFVAPNDGTAGIYAKMLMVDANGVTSSNHLAYGSTVQPAVEGVVDFQVAIGNDLNANGIITDWVGDVWGEAMLNPATNPWNSSNTSTMPQYRQVRLSLLLNTLNSYAGTPLSAWPSTGFEDRPAASYPTITAGTASARYRSVRMIVAPRAWNLSE